MQKQKIGLRDMLNPAGLQCLCRSSAGKGSPHSAALIDGSTFASLDLRGPEQSHVGPDGVHRGFWFLVAEGILMSCWSISGPFVLTA